MLLRHATPRKNLPSIDRLGLLTSKSRGRLRVVWLHAPSKTACRTETQFLQAPAVVVELFNVYRAQIPDLVATARVDTDHFEMAKRMELLALTGGETCTQQLHATRFQHLGPKPSLLLTSLFDNDVEVMLQLLEVIGVVFEDRPGDVPGDVPGRHRATAEVI